MTQNAAEKEIPKWKIRRDELLPLLEPLLAHTITGQLKWECCLYIPTHEANQGRTSPYRAVATELPLGKFIIADMGEGQHRLWVDREGYILWSGGWHNRFVPKGFALIPEIYSAALDQLFEIDARISLTVAEFFA